MTKKVHTPKPDPVYLHDELAKRSDRPFTKGDLKALRDLKNLIKMQLGKLSYFRNILPEYDLRDRAMVVFLGVKYNPKTVGINLRPTEELKVASFW